MYVEAGPYRPWFSCLKDVTELQADNRKLTFEISARPVRYGDNRTFHEYRLGMFHGMKAVGFEAGPRRETIQRADCVKAAKDRVRALLSHSLFIIAVSEKHIRAGIARDCQRCAVAVALWDNRERLGLPRYGSGIEVSTYAAFRHARGIVFNTEYGREESHISAEALPDLVTPGKDGSFYTESMYEWTMHWDEWAESRDMSLKEWRDKHGYDNEYFPCRPAPCSFVLDLDRVVPSMGDVGT